MSEVLVTTLMGLDHALVVSLALSIDSTPLWNVFPALEAHAEAAVGTRGRSLYRHSLLQFKLRVFSPMIPFAFSKPCEVCRAVNISSF